MLGTVIVQQRGGITRTNIMSEGGHHEIEAAKKRLAVAKATASSASTMASSASKMLDSAKSMELAARIMTLTAKKNEAAKSMERNARTMSMTAKKNKVIAENLLKTSSKEVEEANKFLKKVEKKWKVVDVDDDDADDADDSPKKNDSKKRRKINNNNNNNVVPPNPVQTYTQYYHGWTERAEELKTLRSGNSLQWATFYAHQSSRAAHHFHSHPQSTTALFSLPPAPPLSSNPVGSFTRYVKRNTERHEVENNPLLKKLVQGEIGTQLAVAIQQGSFQSKNWDELPLIDLEIHVTTTAP